MGLFNSEELYSPLARGGVPPYFHRQPPTLIYDFDQGCPDMDSAPTLQLKRLFDEVLAAETPEALDYCVKGQYTDLTIGYSRLRDQVADFIGRRDGKRPDPDCITIVNGSTQGIALTINAYAGPGDAVFTEAVTFPFAQKYIGMSGAELVPVDMDADGMKIDALEAQLKDVVARGLRPKLIYTIASHHLPTGAVLSQARRLALLKLAAEHNFMILEDNIYAEFGDGPAPTTLLALDTQGRVIHSDSFAKSVAPAIRVGWVVGSPSAVMGLAKVRQDLGTSSLLQRVMTKYLAEGLHEAHIAQVRPIYRAKREATAAALHKYCEPWITFDEPRGGWYYWLKLSPDVNWEFVQTECYRRGIAMRPGEIFGARPEVGRFMRLAVGHVSPAMIDQGIQVLGRVLAEPAARNG